MTYKGFSVPRPELLSIYFDIFYYIVNILIINTLLVFKIH